jgi:hypothetical protein
MKTPEDVLTDEDLRYLKIAISLALTGVEIEEILFKHNDKEFN